MSAAITRSFFRSTLTVSLLGLLAAACAGEGDVNRVQPDAIDKSIFLNEDGSPRTFYYRMTIVGSPPTVSYAFEGLMGEMAKVRFEITEDNLIGYRAYDYAPGTQNPLTGGENNTDTPVLKFGILKHFDIKREYNPATGEETNVIAENAQDRPWNDRQYMRVDWSQNLSDLLTYDPFLFPSSKSSGRYVGEGEDSLFNQYRPIFTRDYIDFTFTQERTPDLLACYRLFGGDDEIGPWGCGNGELTFRNSLLPVPNSEYEPLAYPDRQILRDEQGKPLKMAWGAEGPIPCTSAALKAQGLTGDDCTEASLDQFSKFGYFRTAVPTYDRQVGATQEGRQFYINRWNIWQETIEKDADGKPLMANGVPVRKPFATRKTRTIKYYLNPEFPNDEKLINEAKRTVEDWNLAMKETVAAYIVTATGAQPSVPELQTRARTLPDIFTLEPNSCNMNNVKAFVEANPDVRSMVEARDKDDVLDFDNLPPSDLLKACTALEVVTQSRKDGDAKKFTWQRNGDLRYSFLHWVDRPQVGGPLGYGPSSQDPQTGEIISASAYIYGAALDIYAKFAVDSVRLANGQLSTDDLLSGKTISDVLASSAAASKARAQEKMSPEAKNLIKARLRALGETRDQRLRKVSAGIDDQPMHKIHGTTLEKLLLNDDVLPAVISGYRPGDSVPSNVFDQAMSKPWLSSQKRQERQDRFQTFATGGRAHGCIYMAEFADDAILGTALELDKMGLSQEEMFKELRVRIFRGLADHEVGHTVGLRHNFSSSSDALNYLDDFWRIRDQFPENAWERDHKLSEFAYASVMDYGSRFNSDVHGLGKYDTAAIRFGYGQMIDLIDDSKLSAYTGLRNAIALDDYTMLPFTTGGLRTFDAPGTTVTPYQGFINMWTEEFRAIIKNGTGDLHVPRERPYKFCEDLFQGNLDCKTWDRGANQREMVSNVTEQFQNYYAFNAYRRGRQNWGIDGYLNRLQERYFNRYSEAFQFFFFFSDYIQYDLGVDLFLASIDSLNSIAAILQTPEPGLHCPTATSPTIATYPVDVRGYLDPNLCLPNQPKLDIQIPDAKPFYINFSDDYYYTLTRVGSLLEKLQALSALTSTESRFFRVDELSDVAARSSINYYRLFRDEVVKLLSGIIRNDHSQYAATFGGTLQNPTLAPMPVVDLETFGMVGAPTPPYAQPGSVHILTPVNRSIRYWALLFGLGRLGSTWDFTLDFHNFLAIGVKGADDDFVAGAGAVVEFTHPETGLVFRAPGNLGGAAPNVGKQLLDELNAITGVSGTRGTIPTTIDSYTDGSPLPNWHTAKADLDTAAAGTDQEAYSDALGLFNYINQLIGYRMDLIGDIRMFRKILLLP